MFFSVLKPLFAKRKWLFCSLGGRLSTCFNLALFSDRIRPYFYPVLVTFHVLTWILFPIGVFPWVMIASTTVFFRDDWHVRTWRLLPWSSWHVPDMKSEDDGMTWSPFHKFLVCTFLGVQLVFPWRTLRTRGRCIGTKVISVWLRVMLMEKAATTYYIQNDQGEELRVSSGDFHAQPRKMMSTQPDLIRRSTSKRFGTMLKASTFGCVRRWGKPECQRSQLMIDPFLDLTTFK